MPVPSRPRVLVTGASSGIGTEFARQLGDRASLMFLVARRADRLAHLADELRARHADLEVVCVPADLAVAAEVDRVVSEVTEHSGGLDLLVNNAGLGHSGLFDSADPERLNQIIDVNCRAVLALTRAFVPGMVERGAGGVLVVGSGAGRRALPAGAGYVASKYFVRGLCESLAIDLDGTGVVVTEVAPGPVTTEFDAAAGIDGHMPGTPPAFMDVSAAQCAREAIAGLDGEKHLVEPGLPYRLLMKLGRLQSTSAVRRYGAKIARRLRHGR